MRLPRNIGLIAHFNVDNQLKLTVDRQLRVETLRITIPDLHDAADHIVARLPPPAPFDGDIFEAKPTVAMSWLQGLRRMFAIDISTCPHAVWLYYRFNLSHRDIEGRLAKRGIVVSYESIRLWSNKAGPR